MSLYRVNILIFFLKGISNNQELLSFQKMYGSWGYLLKAQALAPINARRVLERGWYLRFPSICSDSNSTQSNAVIFFYTEIIHRVVMHEDPPFRPNIPCIEIKPEYIDLMVDCWNDDPEERPHFYRIVERLKKISGRFNFSLILFEAHNNVW